MLLNMTFWTKKSAREDIVKDNDSTNPGCTSLKHRNKGSDNTVILYDLVENYRIDMYSTEERKSLVCL